MQPVEKNIEDFRGWEATFPASDFSTPRLLSLWDIMQQFGIRKFCAGFSLLYLREGQIHSKMAFDPDELESNAADFEEIKKSAIEALQLMQDECKKCDLKESVEHIKIALQTIVFESNLDSPLYQVLFAVESQIRSARTKILEELKRRKFLWVDNALSQYVDRDDLFGPEVKAAFPSASPDIKEAGNCLAVGCYTASVFHLMRAVEWGLRAFCTHLGFRKVKKGKKGQLVPVPYAEWDRILNQLDEHIQKKVDRYKVGPHKQAAQEFYKSSTQEISAIKDAWRNHVMHTRRDYGLEDVYAIMAHVKRLMVRLSAKISE
ncbi:MAG: hypothetical protein ABSF90_17100 [Syntrophobacteraceae bacterium]|jgi:hypothetical protein